jgi:hypothetical protein
MKDDVNDEVPNETPPNFKISFEFDVKLEWGVKVK